MSQWEREVTTALQAPGSTGVDRKVSYQSKYVTMVLDYDKDEGHIRVKPGPPEIVSSEVAEVLVVVEKLGWEELTVDETGDIFDEEDDVVMVFVRTPRGR